MSILTKMHFFTFRSVRVAPLTARYKVNEKDTLIVFRTVKPMIVQISALPIRIRADSEELPLRPRPVGSQGTLAGSPSELYYTYAVKWLISLPIFAKLLTIVLPSLATHVIWTQLKAGETVCQTFLYPKECFHT